MKETGTPIIYHKSRKPPSICRIELSHAMIKAGWGWSYRTRGHLAGCVLLRAISNSFRVIHIICWPTLSCCQWFKDLRIRLRTFTFESKRMMAILGLLAAFELLVISLFNVQGQTCTGWQWMRLSECLLCLRKVFRDKSKYFEIWNKQINACNT